MTWIDAHRSTGFVLAIITIAGMDLTVRGSRDPRTDAWLWAWGCSVGAVGWGTSNDEAGAKAAALAAFDAWIAEIVDARRAVTP